MSNARNLAKLKPSSSGLIGVEDLESSLDLTSKTVTLPAGVGGKVLQVVRGVSGSTTTTSNTFVNATGYSASITPASISNKILVRCLSRAHVSYNNEVYPITVARITANGTEIYRKGYYNYAGRAPNGYVEMQIDFNMEYLHSPATTSAITYQVQLQVDSNAQTTISGNSELVLMEIAA